MAAVAEFISTRVVTEVRFGDSPSRNGVETISAKANELEESLGSDTELMDVLESAYELVELCRSTQKAYIESSAKI